MARLRTAFCLLIASLATIATVTAVSAPAASAAGPAWSLDLSHYPTKVTPGKTAYLAVIPTNIGTAPSSGPVTLHVDVPTGLTPTAMTGTGWVCVLGTRTCTGFLPVAAGTQNSTTTSSASATGITVTATVDATPPSDDLTATATISGGGAAACGAVDQPTCASASIAIPVGVPSLAFGLEPFSTSVIDSSGQDVTQAGGHPWLATTSFGIDTAYNITPNEVASVPTADARTTTVELPPGFVGNPLSNPRCPIYLQTSKLLATLISQCPANTQVGRIVVVNAAGSPSQPLTFQSSPIYSLIPEGGHPAEFAFVIAQTPQVLPATVRSDGTYAIDLSSKDIAVSIGVSHVLVTLWGQPGLLNGTGNATPFISAPTNCSASPPVTSLNVDSWINPGAEDGLGNALLSDPNWKTASYASPALTGCDQLKFEPTISVVPESTKADQPTGIGVHIHIPQVEETGKPATPPLRNAVVTLPQGVAVNPSLAEGLQGCTDAQWSEHDGEAGKCPEASKIGSLEVTTPLLDHKLPGSLYIRQPDPGATRANGLYTIFLEVDDPTTGVIVKLRGSVVPDEKTGQLTATFKDNPQLPFSDLDLSFKGGPNGALVNPGACGSYTTQSQLTPWAGASSTAATPSSSFTVDRCGSGGFQPGFEAGTADNGAGHYSPFTLRVSRSDGEQNLEAIDAILPVGLTAKLAGVPLCGDAEAATGNCPGASQIGTVNAAVGSGSNPLYVPQPGKAPTGVYLAGPYKGGPYSLVVKVPAQAGPFDLGTVAVRSAIQVDPETAQVSVKSDPLPQILEGVPISYRNLQVKVDRSDFTINPTNCNPMSVTGQIHSAGGASAPVSSPFQVGGCDKLAFGPKLKVQLKGATGRTGHPALNAVVTAGPGEANIATAQVNLPHGEFLDQGNLNKTCTKPVLLAGKCPATSVYGHARAWTPLLDQPLEGPVYLVGGYGYKLPALVAELNGQIKILLVGKVDSGKNKGIRNTFEMVPDAPVSRFELSMKGGKKYGLLQNSENLCKASKERRQANVFFSGQNGKVQQSKSLVANQCGKAEKQKKSKAHGKDKPNGQNQKGKN